MSISVDCSGCMRGEHDRHNRYHGTRPGLIGGAYCGCKGDCAERFAEAGRRFWGWVRGTENFDAPEASR